MWEKIMEKIGIGIITYNREYFFKTCINSIPKIGTIVVVNDGTPYDSSAYPDKVDKVIQHEKNTCVGHSKNEALRYLIQDGCEHIFLIEDDMLILNPDIFHKYIELSKLSGIQHFNFAYHGPANKNKQGIKSPRFIVEYSPTIKMSLNPNCVGAVSYYSRNAIKSVGYIDEKFINCWDHVEHTFRIIKKGLHPPFWWFADLADSDEYITELASSEISTTIKRTDKWIRDFQEGAEWYKHKHGWTPTGTPDTNIEQVINIIKNIKGLYGDIQTKN